MAALLQIQGSYGFLPGSLWPAYRPSRIWTTVTDAGSRVVTWENALLNRDPSSPVSFQVEFSPFGDVTYRYSTFPTNGVIVGLFRNGHCQSFTFNSQPSTNISDATSASRRDPCADAGFPQAVKRPSFLHTLRLAYRTAETRRLL